MTNTSMIKTLQETQLSLTNRATHSADP